MGSKVELYEQIRRGHRLEGLSIRELARRHGVHRRTVREALADAVPAPRKAPTGRPAPAMGPWRALVDEWLAADATAPPKQRHTARRIWQRLQSEHGAQVAETTVRDYVRERRRQMGGVREAFCPQHHEPGQEAEVDWGEAQVILRGERVRIGLFHMASCAAHAGFVAPFPRMSQQAFLEGHAEAFAFFGGVFARVRYDNLSSAVKLVLRGRRRVEAERFVALRSHYLFASEFTLPGRAGAHEKGTVESEVGRFRRRHLVPVPRVGSWAELRVLVAGGVEQDLLRTVAGHGAPVGARLAAERARLRPLPPDPHDGAEHTRPRVDAKGLITVRQSRYSVPIALVGLTVDARLGARELVVHHRGREVARHERSYVRLATLARLDHYLDLLKAKPAALAGSLALHQERSRGCWPGELDDLWRAIETRYGASEAARQMVEVLLLAREVGADELHRAVAGALAAGAHDGRAVALLARRRTRPRPAGVELPERLEAVGHPIPDLDAYDSLLRRRGS